MFHHVSLFKYQAWHPTNETDQILRSGLRSCCMARGKGLARRRGRTAGEHLEASELADGELLGFHLY